MSGTDKRWFDAKKIVQVKGPFYSLDICGNYEWDILERHAKEGFYIVLERNGHTRPISEDTFEQRYVRVVDGDESKA